MIDGMHKNILTIYLKNAIINKVFVGINIKNDQICTNNIILGGIL